MICALHNSEDLTLQMACQLHSHSKIQTSASLLPVWWNLILPSREMWWGKVISSSSDRITVCHKWLGTVRYNRSFSLWRIFLALQRGKHREREQREREREWWLSQGERGSQNSPGRQCVWDLGPWGPLDGSRWMGAPRGDQAHRKQVTRGRECFCSAFGLLTHCPTSALAALKPNIFICNALKREGGAAVRIKSSSCWQLHLLLKGSCDRRTMSLRRPALGEGLSYLEMLGM